MADLALYRRVLLEAGPFWPRYAALFLLDMLSGLLALLAPFPLKVVVDHAIGSHPLPRELGRWLPDAFGRSPAALSFLAVGLLVAIALLGWLITPLRARLRVNLTPAILAESLIPLIVSTITLAGMIYVAARIDPPLALITIGVSLGLFAISRVPRRRPAGTTGTRSLLVGLITAVGTGAALLSGVPDVRSGALALGALLVALSYIHQLHGPASTISRAAARLGPGLARARRAPALIDKPPEVEERPDPLPLPRASGNITFHNVSFAPRPNGRMLRDISFAVGAGARLGVLGASRADKRALVGLLRRLHYPSEGEIRHD